MNFAVFQLDDSTSEIIWLVINLVISATLYVLYLRDRTQYIKRLIALKPTKGWAKKLGEKKYQWLERKKSDERTKNRIMLSGIFFSMCSAKAIVDALYNGLLIGGLSLSMFGRVWLFFCLWEILCLDFVARVWSKWLRFGGLALSLGVFIGSLIWLL